MAHSPEGWPAKYVSWNRLTDWWSNFAGKTSRERSSLTQKSTLVCKKPEIRGKMRANRYRNMFLIKSFTPWGLERTLLGTSNDVKSSVVKKMHTIVRQSLPHPSANGFTNIMGLGVVRPDHCNLLNQIGAFRRCTVPSSK